MGKEIDACSLSLQPCVEPVVTPHGVLYDKQVVIEYILTRKKELERGMREWEAQQTTEAETAAAQSEEKKQAQIDEFVARQEGLSQADLQQRAAASSSDNKKGASAAQYGRSLLNADEGRHAADMSFWVPQLTPEAKQTVEKPDMVVRCVVTNEPLRLKQLFPVKFTSMSDDGGPDVAKKANERYICPLSKKALSNIHPAAVLRPSGTVVSTRVVKDCVRKDMLDPFTDPPTPLKEKDIIPLRVEGTGFAGKTEEKALNVKAQIRPVARY